MSRLMSDERVKDAEFAKNREVSYPPKINCAYCPALSPESFFDEKGLDARKEGISYDILPQLYNSTQD